MAQIIIIEGVSGVGKSTVARLLARRLGMPLNEVDAPECWGLGLPERQECFLARFVLALREGVNTNGLLTVAAYSMAFAEMAWNTVAHGYAYVLSSLARTARAVAASLAQRASVVVFYAEPAELHQRRRGKYCAAGDGEFHPSSPIDCNPVVHELAQRRLLEMAATLSIPVIDTTGKTPEDVAAVVVHVVRHQKR